MMAGMIEIGVLRPDDRPRWETLARAYKAFYETEVPDEGYERTWRRLLAADDVHGLAARLDGDLVGIAHYLVHPDPWSTGSLYLQDLFTDESARGRGVARALIEAVADVARERGVFRYYWQTKQDNARARALYDKVAVFRGFVRYDYPLG